VDEVEEEGKEPADDRDGDVVQESDLGELSLLSGPPPAQTSPSRSRSRSGCPSRFQTQKPARASRAVHKDLDSDIELEDDDEDDHPCGEDRGRPYVTSMLTSVVGPLTFRWMKHHARRNNCTRLKSHHGARRRLVTEKTSPRRG